MQSRLRLLLIILLFINQMIGGYYLAVYFDYSSFKINITRLDSFGYSVHEIMRLLGFISVIIGSIISIVKKETRLNAFLKFPIYYTFTTALMLFITSLCSSQVSYFSFANASHWIHYVSTSLYHAIVILTIFYFVKYPNPFKKNATSTKVNSLSRFVNRLIDLIILLPLILINGMLLEREGVFSEIDLSYLFLFVCIFLYYLFSEFLFLQTIGKLHNNSYVHHNGSKAIKILKRTFCRFIPFDAFSFFGKQGWHDSISNTSVVTYSEQED